MKAATGKKGRLHSGPKNYSNFSSEICKPEDTLYLPRPWYREAPSSITSLILSRPSRQGGGLTYPCRNHSSQGLCHFPGSPKWQAAKLHSNPRLPSSKARLLISKHLCLLETHSWGEGEKGRKENGNVKQATPSAPAEDSEQ